MPFPLRYLLSSTRDLPRLLRKDGEEVLGSSCILCFPTFSPVRGILSLKKLLLAYEEQEIGFLLANFTPRRKLSTKQEV